MMFRLPLCCCLLVIAGCASDLHEVGREPRLAAIGAGMWNDQVDVVAPTLVRERPLSKGSIWQAQGADIFRDPRAMRAGDVLNRQDLDRRQGNRGYQVEPFASGIARYRIQLRLWLQFPLRRGEGIGDRKGGSRWFEPLPMVKGKRAALRVSFSVWPRSFPTFFLTATF